MKGSAGDILGPSVKFVQAKLNNVNNAGLTVSGEYDEKTMKAVEEYQRKNGLTDDGIGIVGPLTWASLCCDLTKGKLFTFDSLLKKKLGGDPKKDVTHVFHRFRIIVKCDCMGKPSALKFGPRILENRGDRSVTTQPVEQFLDNMMKVTWDGMAVAGDVGAWTFAIGATGLCVIPPAKVPVNKCLPVAELAGVTAPIDDDVTDPIKEIRDEAYFWYYRRLVMFKCIKSPAGSWEVKKREARDMQWHFKELLEDEDRYTWYTEHVGH